MGGWRKRAVWELRQDSFHTDARVGTQSKDLQEGCWEDSSCLLSWGSASSTSSLLGVHEPVAPIYWPPPEAQIVITAPERGRAGWERSCYQNGSQPGTLRTLHGRDLGLQSNGSSCYFSAFPPKYTMCPCGPFLKEQAHSLVTILMEQPNESRGPSQEEKKVKKKVLSIETQCCEILNSLNIHFLQCPLSYNL